MFQALIINDDRTTVLAALLEQAAEYFGHDELRITNVRVAADGFSGVVLASADVSARDEK